MWGSICRQYLSVNQAECMTTRGETWEILGPISKLRMCMRVRLEEPRPASNHFYSYFSLSLCLSSCDDFTEPRNLKLSLELQPASEKPINSSFKRFVSLCVCVSVWTRRAYSRGLDTELFAFNIKSFSVTLCQWLQPQFMVRETGRLKQSGAEKHL